MDPTLTGASPFSKFNPTGAATEHQKRQSRATNDAIRTITDDIDELQKIAGRMILPGASAAAQKDAVMTTGQGRAAKDIVMAANAANYAGTQGNYVHTAQNIMSAVSSGGGGYTMQDAQGQYRGGGTMSGVNNHSRALGQMLSQQLHKDFKDPGSTNGMNMEDVSEIVSRKAHTTGLGTLGGIKEATGADVYANMAATHTDQGFRSALQEADRVLGSDASAQEKKNFVMAKARKADEGKSDDQAAIADAYSKAFDEGEAMIGKSITKIKRPAYDDVKEFIHGVAGGVAELRDVYGEAMTASEAMSKMTRVTGIQVEGGSEQARQASAMMSDMTALSTKNGMGPAAAHAVMAALGQQQGNMVGAAVGARASDATSVGALGDAQVFAAMEESLASEQQTKTSIAALKKRTGGKFAVHETERRQDSLEIAADYVGSAHGSVLGSLLGAANAGILTGEKAERVRQIADQLESATSEEETDNLNGELQQIHGKEGYSPELSKALLLQAAQDRGTAKSLHRIANREGSQQARQSLQMALRSGIFGEDMGEPLSASVASAAIDKLGVGGMGAVEEAIDAGNPNAARQIMQDMGIDTETQDALMNMDKTSRNSLQTRVALEKTGKSTYDLQQADAMQYETAEAKRQDLHSKVAGASSKGTFAQKFIKGMINGSIDGSSLSDSELITYQGAANPEAYNIATIDTADGYNTDELTQMAKIAGVDTTDKDALNKFATSMGFHASADGKVSASKNMAEQLKGTSDASRAAQLKFETNFQSKTGAVYGVGSDGKRTIASAEELANMKEDGVGEHMQDQAAYISLATSRGADANDVASSAVSRKLLMGDRLTTADIEGDLTLGTQRGHVAMYDSITESSDVSTEQAAENSNRIKRMNDASGGAVLRKSEEFQRVLQRKIEDDGADATIEYRTRDKEGNYVKKQVSAADLLEKEKAVAEAAKHGAGAAGVSQMYEKLNIKQATIEYAEIKSTSK